MNENTRKLKEIYNYCKTHKYSDGCNCVIARNCIYSKKSSRYNDPRFLDKTYNKVKRAIAKELEETENNPFTEIMLEDKK